jgi:hypothetical protein
MSGQQKTVSYASAKGLPGQIADLNNCVIISAVATTTILPGTFVEITLAADGETFIAKTPNSSAATLGDGGVAVYFPTSDPSILPALGVFTGITGTGYQVGDTVAVLREGKVFVSCDVATTAGSLSAPWAVNANVQHPSTTGSSATNTNGVFTAVTANTTAGTETTAQPGCYFERIVAPGLALLAVNKPKSA